MELNTSCIQNQVLEEDMKWSNDFLEKLIGAHLVKKFSAFHGT
jgi:hypothetical protein